MMPNELILALIIGGGLLLASQPARGYIAPLPKTTSAWKTPPAGRQYDPYFEQAERLYDLPAGMLSRVAYQESRYNPDAVGRAGEIGMMQIMPKWHPGVDASDPIDSIFYAAEYLRENYERFGNWRDALAAYNWGPTILEQKGFASAPYSVKRYAQGILKDIGYALSG